MSARDFDNGYRPRAVRQPLLSMEESMRQCARNGDESGVLRYLVEGVSPNAMNEHGNTAIHGAARPEIIALLVEMGADINARNNAGYTALHDTIETEHLELARVLLRCGADIDARNDYGETPLRTSVETSGTYRVASPKMARFFIENGADVSARDNSGETVLGQTAHYLIIAPDDAPSQEIFDLLYKYGALRD